MNIDINKFVINVVINVFFFFFFFFFSEVKGAIGRVGARGGFSVANRYFAFQLQHFSFLSSLLSLSLSCHN